MKINKDAETSEDIHESAKLYFNRMEQGLQYLYSHRLIKIIDVKNVF